MMKKKRFSEEQIVRILRQAEAADQTVSQGVNYAVKSSFVLPVLEVVEGLELSKADVVVKDRAGVIAKARKAAVMVLCY